MEYTQNESYYFLDTKDEGFVDLGLKENIDPELMPEELEIAQEGEADFDADKFVQKWPVKNMTRSRFRLERFIVLVPILFFHRNKKALVAGIILACGWFRRNDYLSGFNRRCFLS